MRSVRDIPKLENIPVLVRTAMNVPIENGKVANDYRLRRALPTIAFLSERGARVILISHIGEEGTETLAPVAQALGTLIPRVSFFPETIGVRARDAVRRMAPGDILVLENLRRSRGEKLNDPEFAQELASLADVFVQDSFDTCHREHASIIGVPALLPSYAGLLLEDEVRELSAALSPKRPSLAAIGGAKFSTKEGVLSALLQKYDQVFVGGALANDFLKASGRSVGKSLVASSSNENIEAMLANPKLILPLDSVVVPSAYAGAPDACSCAHAVSVDAIADDDVVLDHGPGTIALLNELTKGKGAILWNGPFGNYEHGFVNATDAFAKAASTSKAHTVVGGGDTIASIENLGILSRFSFVSTGGGAMLDFLANGTLPGIAALESK